MNLRCDTKRFGYCLFCFFKAVDGNTLGDYPSEGTQTRTQTLGHLGNSLGSTGLGKGQWDGVILIAALCQTNQIKCFVLQATFGPYFTPKPVFTMKDIKIKFISRKKYLVQFPLS